VDRAVFSIFFEAEPLAAILKFLIAHGTHGLSQKFVLGALLRPKGLKFKAEGQKWGRGSSRRVSELGGLGESCKLLQWGSGQTPNRKCILDALRAEKMHLHCVSKNASTLKRYSSKL